MTSDAAALTFEQSHVHQVYDVIASDFSRTRHTRWPFVERFVEQLPSSSVVLDAGCGNGKYLGVDSCLSCDYQPARPPAALAEAAEATWRKSRLLNVGLDMSRGLLEIAAERGHEVVRADCYDSAACFRPGVVDHAISIATIHHFSSHARRVEAVRQLILSILPSTASFADKPSQSTRPRPPPPPRPRSRALIVVWALEQDPKFNGQGSARKLKPKGNSIETRVSEAPAPEASTSDDASAAAPADVFVPWELKDRVTKQARANGNGAHDESMGKGKGKASPGTSIRDTVAWASMSREERKQAMLSEREAAAQSTPGEAATSPSSAADAEAATPTPPPATTYQRYYHLFRHLELSQLVREASEQLGVRVADGVAPASIASEVQYAAQGTDAGQVVVRLEEERWERENWVVELSVGWERAGEEAIEATARV